MARVADIIPLNSASTRWARFEDVSMKLQSEMDQTVVTARQHQGIVTVVSKAVPKTITSSSN
jgi:metal-dependent hydrolase (beta-lactamase superfamily II)